MPLKRWREMQEERSTRIGFISLGLEKLSGLPHLERGRIAI